MAITFISRPNETSVLKGEDLIGTITRRINPFERGNAFDASSLRHEALTSVDLREVADKMDQLQREEDVRIGALSNKD
ncbi:MAG: hypothetical protein Q7S63_02355 [bacterium]|nr:hypothetical protein [bacterium]